MAGTAALDRDGEPAGEGGRGKVRADQRLTPSLPGWSKESVWGGRMASQPSEKKVYLVDMSILSILLSPEPGYHTHPPLEDRRPRRSTPVQELSPIGHVHASSADPCATTGHMSAHLTRTCPCYRKGRL
jgi:hypothetical protein